MKNKLKNFLKNKENILYIFIIILFVTFSIIISLKHENWADEAHAWLMARDTSIKDLIFIYLHSDGHPCLWHLILKFFQLIGLPYKYMFVISTLFSSIGVTLLLFKSKFPKWIKVLLPFTYFIFYQYTVITRGYCLIFPLLAMIAIIWDKRHEKITTFSILLLLLLSTEAYTFLLAGVIYVIYLYETFKSKEYHNKKHLISLILLFLAFCFTIYYVCPQAGNKFNPYDFRYFISSSFFTSFDYDSKLNRIICNIATAILIVLIYLCYKKDYNKLIEFILLIFPVIMFLTFKYNRPWHHGIVFLAFIFIMWIHKKEDNKFAKIIFFLSIAFQLPCSVISSIYDYNNVYDASYEMSKFIKKYDYENLNIKAVGFYTSNINAFLDSNIFENYDDNLGFYYWHENSKYYQTTLIDKELDYDYIFDADMVVVSDRMIIDESQYPDYNCYYFFGNSFVEYEVYERFPAQIFVKKSIDEQLQS